MSTIDVLIVGAGPVGMALALELAIQGVSFRIVDKAPTRSQESRAIGVHSRTVEVLNRYGDIDELLSKSHKLKGNVFWVNGQRFDGFRFPAEPVPSQAAITQFPGIFAISQVDTEAFFQRHLADKGVVVERPVTVKETVLQDSDGATVVLVKADGSEETVRAKYLVGCDGAHSVVRHAMDVEFVGDAYAQEFILADALVDWDGVDDKGHIMLGSNGMLMLLPLRQGRARIVLSRPSDVSLNTDPKLEDFQKALNERLPAGENARVHDPFWLARFHLHHRCSSKYRDGRLFVAGDAAHIHSPVGGQGMNTGIQDSVNLGWKLARVLAGEKPDSFLDSYHEERWPIGQHLLNNTDQMFTFLTSNTPIFNSMRTNLLPHALPSLVASDMGPKLVKYFSGLDVKYRKSSIVHADAGFEGPIGAGFRAADGQILAANGKNLWLQDLLRGPEYHLLVFVKTAEDKEVEEAEKRYLTADHGSTAAPQVHIITSVESRSPRAVLDVEGVLHNRYGFDNKPGFVQVRPDGYIESIGYLE